MNDQPTRDARRSAVQALFGDDHREAWRRLYRYVYLRVQNREEAEDITQEAYARVLARRPAAPPAESPFRWYLQTVALNLIRDRWRRRRVRGQEVPLEDIWLARLGEAEADGAEAAVSRAWVEGLLGRLPEDQRTVLQLRIVRGHSRAQTARLIGISEDAVRGLQYRAVQSLRRLIREYSEEETP